MEIECGMDEFEGGVLELNEKHLLAMVRSKCVQANSGKKLKVGGSASLFWIVRNHKKWASCGPDGLRDEIDRLF